MPGKGKEPRTDSDAIRCIGMLTFLHHPRNHWKIREVNILFLLLPSERLPLKSTVCLLHHTGLCTTTDGGMEKERERRRRLIN